MLMVFDLNSISEKSPTGYILQVDLEYPDELHVLHNDYPLAPEKRADEYEIKVGDVKKSQIWASKLIMCFITKIFSYTCL